MESTNPLTPSRDGSSLNAALARRAVVPKPLELLSLRVVSCLLQRSMRRGVSATSRHSSRSRQMAGAPTKLTYDRGCCRATRVDPGARTARCRCRHRHGASTFPGTCASNSGCAAAVIALPMQAIRLSLQSPPNIGSGPYFGECRSNDLGFTGCQIAWIKLEIARFYFVASLARKMVGLKIPTYRHCSAIPVRARGLFPASKCKIAPVAIWKLCGHSAHFFHPSQGQLLRMS